MIVALQIDVEVPTFIYYEITSEEDMQYLQQAMAMKDANPRGYDDLPEELKAASAYTTENKIPVRAQQDGTVMQQEEKILRNQPTLDILDPENCFFDPSCLGDIDKAGFVVISFETSKAELKKDGRYKNLDGVHWSANTVLSQPDHATNTPNDFNFKDDLRRKVVAYEYWGFYDIHKDDTLVPIVATWIGDIMIRMEENPFPDEKLPFVVATYLPVKRQITGEPDAEILEDNQKILGAVTRGMVDLMGRSANAQQGTAKGFLDVVNRRRFERGLDYEFNPGNGDPRLSIYQHTYPEIPNSALTMMQLQNQDAEALTGVKSFSGGISGNAYGDVAAGIKGMLDAAAKREMNILRRLAKGVQDIGTKLAAMNAVFLSDREVVRITNKKFVEIKREDLKGNFDIIIDISTPEVDAAKAQDMGFMLQTMGPTMAPAMSQMILADIADLKRMPELAEKIRTYQPQPDPFEEQMKQLQLAKIQKEIAKLDSEIAKNNAEAAKKNSEKDAIDLDFVENENGTNHARGLQKQSEQARSNQDLEVTKAFLKTRKPEEREPDVAAAIGYNRLSDMTNSRV